MALIMHEHVSTQTEVGLWKIEETEDWFLDKLSLHSSERHDLSLIKGSGRRKEWLASRWLLHLMSGRQTRGICLKDGFGKPYLENSPYEISLSHTHQMTAVIASKSHCGIDIQKRVPSITKLAHKFVNETEERWIDSKQYVDDLHLIWGAKEALYKTYSRKKVNFKKHLILEKIDRNKGELNGKILKHYEEERKLYYSWILSEYLLVYTY